MKTILTITIAALITMAAIVFQRATGPTYPQKAEVAIDDATYQMELLRSHGGEKGCDLKFIVPDTAVTGFVEFRKYPTRDEWTKEFFTREGDTLAVTLPHQPPAGKLEYKMEFHKKGKTYLLHETHATVIRFKGDVPAAILVPHIILMFVAMFFANLAGVMAIGRHIKLKLMAEKQTSEPIPSRTFSVSRWLTPRQSRREMRSPEFRTYAIWTVILLGLGGIILGPWVQYHAFGEAWAGIPFAWDLTDNKTLIAFLAWVLAVAMNRKQERPAWVILASLVMLAVYSIPHSLFGSQLDPETGKIIQGFILFRE